MVAKIPNLPFYAAGYGLKTPWGTLLPPGGRVAAYVRSTGIQDADDQHVANRLVKTLAAALGRVRAGLGDTIYVLPGHAENVSGTTMFANLRAGTRIIGAGDVNASNAPKFTWTATAAQWIVAVDDVTISNLHLDMSGANGVVLAIDVSNSGFSLLGNRITTATGATAKVTTAVVLDATSHNARIEGNQFYGTETHNSTNLISVTGAANGVRFCYNTGIASITAANGFINFAAASKRILVAHNLLYNTHTSSTSCVTVGNVAADGLIAYNSMGTVNNGTASSQGLVLGGAALVRCIQNYSCDQPILSGILAPVAAT